MSGLTFFSVPPRDELAPFVEAIWGVRCGAGDIGGFAIESVLPSGAIELMVNFGPTQRVVGHGERELELTYQRAWLAGIQDRRLVHASHDGVDHLSVRFRPGGAHAFLDVPMSAVANDVVELEQLLGREADRLRDHLGEARSDATRVARVQDWLLARRRVHAGFDVVTRAVEMLGRRRDPLSVAEACTALGLSNKHLVDRFHKLVGLSPKVVGRVLRFQRVIDACRERASVDWSDVAARFGYADQSHLIREFRRLGGVTPSSFLAHRTPDESNVLLDEPVGAGFGG